ncbi:MAG: hypothetical protein Q8R30_00720 [bacterium]|nr:hypothetical protein [bacterium]
MTLSRIPHIDYTNHPAYGLLFGRPSFDMRIKALRRFMPFFLRYKRLLLRKANQKVKSSFPPAQKLFEDGAVIFGFDENEIRTLTERSRPYVQEIDRVKKETPLEARTHRSKTFHVNPKKDSAFYRDVAAMLEKRDIPKIASLYRNCSMELTDLVVQVSDVDDPNLMNYFPDVHLPDPPTSYFHIDGSEEQVKCMIYVSHVTSADGPMAYVVGSNRHHIGKLELLTRMANDKARLDRCKRENRELFWALPKFFQKKAEFGNDLNPASPEAQEILARERVFTSEDGNCIVFDPNGYHRGRVVIQGRREAIQVVFRPHGYRL